MVQKTVFISVISHADAQQQAEMAGYIVVGYGRNKKGQYVVFARR